MVMKQQLKANAPKKVDKQAPKKDVVPNDGKLDAKDVQKNDETTFLDELGLNDDKGKPNQQAKKPKWDEDVGDPDTDERSVEEMNKLRKLAQVDPKLKEQLEKKQTSKKQIAEVVGISVGGWGAGGTYLGMKGMDGLKSDVKTNFGLNANDRSTNALTSGQRSLGAGGIMMGLGGLRMKEGASREKKASLTNDQAGMTLGNTRTKEGALDVGSGAFESGKGMANTLKGMNQKQALDVVKSNGLPKNSKARNDLLNSVAKDAGKTMGQVATGIGLAGHAYQGGRSLYELGKTGKKGMDLKAIKEGSGGGIVTDKGGSWFKQIQSGNRGKALLQGLKLLGVGLGIVGLLASGPVGLVLGLAGALTGGLLSLGRYFKRRMDDNSSKKIQNADAPDKKNEVPEFDGWAEIKVEEEIEEQIGDEKNPPKKKGFFSKLFSRDPKKAELKRQRKEDKKRDKETRKQNRRQNKIDKNDLKEARKERLQQLKKLKKNKSGFDKSEKTIAKLRKKQKKAESKGKMGKYEELEVAIQEQEDKMRAFKKAGFPPEDASKKIDEAKKLVFGNRQAAFEMVDAMRKTPKSNPTGLLPEQLHHDAELLTGDALGVTKKEALSSSGQELIEKKMSAFDGL